VVTAGISICAVFAVGDDRRAISMTTDATLGRIAPHEVRDASDRRSEIDRSTARLACHELGQ
jgi:hypothetical protein